MKKRMTMLVVLLSVLLGLCIPGVALADQPMPAIMHMYNNDTPQIAVLDENGNPTEPRINFANQSSSFNCTPFNSGTHQAAGSLGANDRRVYVMMPPSAAPNGWSLDLAGEDGPSTLWTDSSGHKMDFNDPTSDTRGCIDSDQDGAAGVLDGSLGGNVTTDCEGCNSDGIHGGSGRFSASMPSITVMGRDAGYTNAWRGYLSGFILRQTIPAGQPQGDYTLPLVLTLTIQ